MQKGPKPRGFSPFLYAAVKRLPSLLGQTCGDCMQSADCIIKQSADYIGRFRIIKRAFIWPFQRLHL